jgi:hypothetical protein
MASTQKQFMAYLPYAQYALLKKYSLKSGANMSQVIREALETKLGGGDQYVVGFNAGLTEAIKAVRENKAAKMRFPSGASFADLVVSDLNKLWRTLNEDGKTSNGGAAKSNAGGEGQTDPDLGI